MSSINPHFTFQYSQPSEYKFSHDSVFLARQVFDFLKSEDLSQFHCLDLCAGCGVVGLDFLFHFTTESVTPPASFDFLEIQNIYQTHFIHNQAQLPTMNTRLEFKNLNYDQLKTKAFQNYYDLILSNPPYFSPDQGKLSPSEFKNRCRFFLDSDFKNLIEGIEFSLKKGGRAYVLIRNLEDHGINYLSEARRHLHPSTSLEVCGDIRGTHLALITKKV